VGEIGRDRREYLFDMSYCDILLIQRGYRRRNILQYQLQRLQAYGAFHCMSGSKKTPEQWLPLYVDRYKMVNSAPISEDEMAEMLEDMKQIGNPWKK
jgi:hypothetical protein